MKLGKIEELISTRPEHDPRNPVEAYHRENLLVGCYGHEETKEALGTGRARVEGAGVAVLAERRRVVGKRPLADGARPVQQVGVVDR